MDFFLSQNNSTSLLIVKIEIKITSRVILSRVNPLVSSTNLIYQLPRRRGPVTNLIGRWQSVSYYRQHNTACPFEFLKWGSLTIVLFNSFNSDFHICNHRTFCNFGILWRDNGLRYVPISLIICNVERIKSNIFHTIKELFYYIHLYFLTILERRHSRTILTRKLSETIYLYRLAKPIMIVSVFVNINTRRMYYWTFLHTYLSVKLLNCLTSNSFRNESSATINCGVRPAKTLKQRYENTFSKWT